MARKLTTDNFQAEILDHEGLAIVDFWADWCPPCRMLAPVIEDLSNELDDVKVAKMDVDASPDIAMKYGIRSIPTVIIFKDGEPVEQMIGALPKAAYTQALEKHA